MKTISTIISKFSTRNLLVLLGAIIVLPLFMPQAAGAQTAAGFLNCSGVDCSACNVVYTANKLIIWLVGILFMVFALLMVRAGFLLVTSGGSPSALSDAKSSFQNAIIGLIILLSAWIIVDTLMRGLGVTDGRGGAFPWSEVQCQSQTDPHHAPRTDSTPAVPATQVNRGTAGPAASQVGCPSCEQMSSYVSCRDPNRCTIDAGYAERMRATLQASGETMQVTEGYPPSRTHQNACHNNGTCVDIVFQNRQWDQTRINNFQTAAQANGCRAVYEPNAAGSCPTGTYIQGRANNTCMPHSVTRSTGNHFSLYCN